MYGYTMGLPYFNRQGEPIGADEWSVEFERWPERQLALSHTADATVSTVWMGIGLHHDSAGRPLIFESEVNRPGMETCRYIWATEAEALAGHAAVCELLRVGWPGPDET